MAEALADAGAQANAAVAGVLDDMAAGPQPGVVVDSPPGAGKSTLVVAAAGHLLGAGEEPMIVAQTNAQVDDLMVRLAAEADPPLMGRLSAADYEPAPEVEKLRAAGLARIGTTVDDLAGCRVVLGTAAKWAMVRQGRRPWAIIDEAYQMRSDVLLPIAARFDRALFVGDPGQLDPFSTVESPRWVGLDYDPMDSAVAVVLRNNKDLRPHRLPVSWRLPAAAAPLVSDAFYPFSGFRAATGPGARRVEFAHPARGDAMDHALDVAARTGWALFELPERHTRRTDAEALAACAHLASRIVERRAAARCERRPDGPVVATGDVAVGTAHRDQADQIRKLLRTSTAPGRADITVDTANRLQGREFAATVVLHPLSGRRDATAFHLEAGRLCVLASRHRHLCIVVARAGIAELLDAHPSVEPVHLNTPAMFPDGWEANQAVLAHLAGHRVPAD